MTVSYDWTFDSGNTQQAINPVTEPAGANAAAQQALTESVGPAPAPPIPNDSVVTLPVGTDIDGQLVRDAEIRELTGEDEEAIAKVATNSREFFNVLLNRGVTRIGTNAPTPELLDQLYIGDADALLLAIRVATFGNKLEMTNVRCPNCDERIDVTIDLATVPQRGLPPQPHKVDLRTGSTAYVKFPKRADQAYILADPDSSDAHRNTLLLERCLDRVEAPDGTVTQGSLNVARRMGIADRRTILLYLADNAPGPELAGISVEHAGCGKEIPLPLTLTDCFLSL
ncbi:T4 family baseplate hub assembly chaperone [Streptomyces sp. WZ-12]|uniref:T4 family baseplate hub assembly chaperone n=1 Tax=Streptomyces sp. WZ-12 TaxID=3030210 RepID=UPI002380ED05|nr:hypothetical protein [Streptomyces sp. WZ-12]